MRAGFERSHFKVGEMATRTGSYRGVFAACATGLMCIAIFAGTDAFLERYADTSQQMLIRLVVVSTALSGAMLLLLSMAHRLRAAKDQIRLNHEQAQTRLHAAQEQARLEGVLLMLRELVPRLNLDAGGISPAAGSARNGKPPAAKHGHDPSEPSMLTPREWEIAAHVAGGRTNREIAAALVISERTVETHL